MIYHVDVDTYVRTSARGLIQRSTIDKNGLRVRHGSIYIYMYIVYAAACTNAQVLQVQRIAYSLHFVIEKNMG